MLKQPAKYNPAFLGEQKLVESFVARHTDLSILLGVLKENIGQPSNQHVLLIGQRGTGKTTLVLRVAAEVKCDDELRSAWYPLIFAEESYQVATPGEFWLEAVFRLGEKTGDERWKRTYEELRRESNDDRLRERALSQLMDFADSIGKRLLLIVENLDMLLADQLGEDEAWSLRHTFQNEPRIMVLATAIRRVDEIGGKDKAMYELFKIYELKPLGSDECRAVWASITGKEISEQRVKPIRILTGGNPRLLTIISSFGANMSFRELMADIMQLVDEHTEYFKSHLDNLAAVERKVYLALAELWDPSPARKIAAMARLDVNKTSSFLNRLADRGAVEVMDGGKRTRMYNIYYLMRRRGAPSGRVQAVVNFMISFYDEEELLDITKCIAAEACELSSEFKEYNYYAYKSIIEKMADRKTADRFIRETPPEFFNPSSIPKSLEKEFISGISAPSLSRGKRGSAQTKAKQQLELLLEEAERLIKEPKTINKSLELFKKALDMATEPRPVLPRYYAALYKAGKYDEAEEACRKAVKIDPRFAGAWAHLGQVLHEKLERYDEAEQAYRKSVEIDPKYTWAWAHLGQLLHERLGRYDEAEQAYRKAVEIDPQNNWAWAHLGQLLHEKLERYDEAEQVYRKAVEIAPQYGWTWAQLGQLLQEKLGRYDEAEQAYRRAVEIAPQYGWTWAQLGQLLQEKLGRYDEAEQAYRNAVEMDPQFGYPWVLLGQLLHEKLERYNEAEQAYRKAVEIAPQFAWSWALLGQLLHEKLERYDEAERAYCKAVEIDPQFATAWALLGQLLHEKLGRYDEAERAYRKAVEIAPQYDWAWAHLGELLHEKLGRYDEAEQAINTAFEIKPKVAAGWVWLGNFLYEKLDKPHQAETAFKNALAFEPLSLDSIRCIANMYLRSEKSEKIVDFFIEYQEILNKSSSALNELAFAYCRSGRKEHAAEAEEWARKAVAMSPRNPYFQHTLASILVGQGKCDLALEPTKKYLEAPEVVGDALEYATNLMVNLAARGYAERAMELLVESPVAEFLEPLIVGIRLYLGEEVRVATEILEVGKDVAKRIKGRADLLSQES